MAKTMTPILKPAKRLRQLGKKLRALGGASDTAIAYLTGSEMRRLSGVPSGKINSQGT
jgi:hypothetical protein